MITYYSIVHADTKRSMEWRKGHPGYGWPNRPHHILDKIATLEANFEDGDKLVKREVIGGARPQVAYLTIEEAKRDIPLKAELYLTVHPELAEDRMMKETLKALRFFRERGQRTKKAREEEELF